MKGDSRKKSTYNNAMEMVPTTGSLFKHMSSMSMAGMVAPQNNDADDGGENNKAFEA